MSQQSPHNVATFRPGEHLKRERDIQALFGEGRAVHVPPVRFLYRKVPRPPGEQYAIRTGFSAPKKKFPKAVDRNRIKRLLREAWRLQKAAYQPAVGDESQLHLFLIFSGNVLPEYADIAAAMPKGVEKLLGRIAFEEVRPGGSPVQ